MNSLSSTFIKIITTKNTTITTSISSSGEASGIDPQAFYRGCGEPGVPAGQGLTCTVEQLFDVKVFFDLILKGLASYCKAETTFTFISPFYHYQELS